MQKAEVAAGLLVLTIGAVLLIESYKLPYLIEKVPGPGFLPLWVSIGILVTGVVLTLKAMRARLSEVDAVSWPDALGWRQVFVMLAALAVALLLLDAAGFLVVTALFMTVVIFSLGVRSWGTLITAPIAAAGILYLVFAVWLRVPLPQGLLGLLFD